jgi:hypothetical protein
MNSLKKDLTGKTVLLRADAMSPRYRDEKQRIVKVLGGFGAVPYTRGTALIVKFLSDGEEARFEGFQVEKIIE